MVKSKPKGATKAPVGSPSWYRAQKEVKLKLCRRFDASQYMKREHKRLKKMLLSSVRRGENNSILIIGPRSSGKTTLVNKVVGELLSLADISSEVCIVRLNGFIQNTDPIALKEIANQLGVDFEGLDTGSFSATFRSLLDAFKTGSQDSRVLLFIMEEFDLFAKHKNQLLLYNLFDLSQSKQIPISLVGTTCTLTATELLEKRVKSRFSFRQIYLHGVIDFPEYIQIFKKLLKVSDRTDEAFVRNWNTTVEELSKSETVRGILERVFTVSTSIHSLQVLLSYPVGCVGENQLQLNAADFVTAYSSMYADAGKILHGLSTLELCLLIGMKHLSEMYRNQPFNLRMVYKMYEAFVLESPDAHSCSLSLMLKACEHLEALEIVYAVGGCGAGANKEYKMLTLAVQPHIITEAVLTYPDLPLDILKWAKQLAHK